MKKILKEQILNGSCANKTYIYPNPGNGYANITHIVTNYGITAKFSEYYQQHPNQNHPNCCKDENGACLGKWNFINSKTIQGGIYIGGVSMAATWKQFIDQVNAVHQANNIPEQANYNWTFGNSGGGQPHALTQAGIINVDFFSIAGNTCMGCPDPIQPPIYGCIDQTAINYDPNATTDDGSCEYHYNCVDGECVKDVNGIYSSVMECQKSPCGTPVRDDVKNTTTTDDDDGETELNCKHNPEEGCWSCHSNPQAGGSCWQPPQMWIDTYHPSLGHNFYNTETDCINAGPLCKKDENKKKDKKDKVTQDISEDIKRMNRLIKY